MILMIDREMVKKSLENCISSKGDCTPDECPYYDRPVNDVRLCWERLMADAIILLNEDYRSWLMDMFHKYERDDLAALLVQYGEEDLLATVLKEQEAVKPKYRTKSIYSWECGVCGEPFDRIAKFCPECGRKVKWE